MLGRSTGGGLSIIGDEYLAQVDAARDLLELATASTGDLEGDLNIVPDWLTGSQKEKFRDAAREFALNATAFLDSNQGDASVDLSVIVKVDDIDVSRALSETIFRFAHRSRMPSRKSLLMRSMLSLAISDFEFLMSRVIGHLLKQRPTLLGADSALSLADLESVGDVVAARGLVIDRKVDDLMRQSLDKWATWFERSGVKFSEMCDDWADFGEIFARRNLVVHTGGRVSEQYRSALRTLGTNSADIPELGAEVGLTPDYLERSSEDLLSFGFLLVGATWLQLKEDPREAEGWLRSRAGQLVNRGHYRATRTICRTVLERSRGRLRRDTELSLRILLWTARRELDEEEKVLNEVAGWDTSGIDLRYTHVRSVLLGEDERAVAEIQELRRRQHLSSSDLLMNPLYAQLLERRQADLLDNEISIPAAMGADTPTADGVDDADDADGGDGARAS